MNYSNKRKNTDSIGKQISKQPNLKNEKPLKKNNKNNFSLGVFSRNDDWPTPKYFYDALNKEFKFDFDPCPLGGKDNLESDGLKIEWGKTNFVNPPYSDIKSWIFKALQELLKGKKSVFLITAKTGSLYWHDLIFPFASEIRFLKSTIIFGNHTKPFPVPLALVIFDPKSLKNNPGTVKPEYTYASYKS